MTLQRHLPPAGSRCGVFRGEPAIPGLDWTFTPRRGSSERFAHQHRFGPPRRFRAASPCPRLDRPASGRAPATPRSSYAAPHPKGCGHVGFPTPSGLNPLGSPLRHTPWPVFQNVRRNPGPCPSYYRLAAGSFEATHSFRATPLRRHLVSGSFHLPSGVLFSFRSPY